MLRKFRSFRSLPPADRWRVLEAFATLPLVSLGLRSLGYARCRRWLERRVGVDRFPGGRTADLELSRRCERAVRIAAHNVPCRAFCLERSLTLWWLLRRRGIDGELHLGVRKSDGRDLDAHAWVEIGGRPINDRDDVRERYHAFESGG